MKRVLILCGLGLLLAVSPLAMLGAGNAQAVLIEIPIPEFTGTYDENNFGDQSAFLPFIYDPAEIISVSVRVTGSTTAGVANCLGEPGPWPIELFAYIGNYSDDEFWTASPAPPFLEDGSFALEMVFEHYPTRPDTWNLLDDGGDISLFVAPAMLLGICSGIVEPSIQIDEFVVIFDMALAVPAERTTWDSIKAQYR